MLNVYYLHKTHTHYSQSLSHTHTHAHMNVKVILIEKETIYLRLIWTQGKGWREGIWNREIKAQKYGANDITLCQKYTKIFKIKRVHYLSF